MIGTWTGGSGSGGKQDEREQQTPTGRYHRLAGKYLTFALGQEQYGLPVLKVREIIKMMDVTAVPQAPRHVKGVVNLRGKVIPVIDLRLKFDFEPQEYTDRTSIIVVEVALQSRRVLMGIVVDAVCDVLSIGGDDIEDTPEFGHRVNTDYMTAIAKVKGTVKILLDLDRVLGADGVAA
jgi:purine-binding chemotaxis protein CheW